MIHVAKMLSAKPLLTGQSAAVLVDGLVIPILSATNVGF